MTTVTQTIPTLIGGLSQQPDELKFPGQVNVAQNVLPDVTHGLLKRPGGQLVKSLSDGTLNSYDTGVWFHYYRDEGEQYIGQIIRRPTHADDGKIRMWKCSDGSEMNVTQPASTQTYLQLAASDSDSDLQTLTLNDFTFITNRTKTVSMLSGTSDKEPVRPPEVFIELKQIKYASQYAVNLYDNDTTTSVSTATRISVERVIDSGNACLTAANDATPPGGSQSTVYSTFRSQAITSSYTSRCDDSLTTIETTSGLKIEGNDALVPNVATKIFSITGGSTYTDEGDTINPLVKSGSTYSNFTDATKKDLYFRITTTGQSVSEKSSSSDVVYNARYQTTFDLLHGGQGWAVGDEVYVWMKLALYKVRIEAISSTAVKANLGLIRPEPTPFDTETTVTAEAILGSIKQEISGFTIEQIGNGLYITRSSGTFNVSTPVGQLLNCVAGEVQDVADLPKQCKHGFVVKVANSAAEEDDYYLKFIGKKKADGTFLDGEGVWEECALPGTEIAFNNQTMPIQMVRTNATTFTVSHVTWDQAQVGDTSVDGTNPRPSFVDKKINNILFFRNRLVFLSDEHVIMSRPGDFFNFWNKSAITFSNVDPIDLSCSSEYPAIVYDGLAVNSGLVLFTKNRQFLLTTDSDILNPTTAKINSIATYNYNHNTSPISLGTTVGFLDNANKFSRFFEMTAIFREGEPQVIEQSKPVSTSFAKDINLISNSRENSVIFFSTNDSSDLYGFRYFMSGNERKLQSWFTWKVTGTIRYHCMLDDTLYAVVRNNSKDQLVKYSIKLDDNGFFVTDTDGVIYRVNLDHSSTVTISSNTYNQSTNKTTFPKPVGYESSQQLAVYEPDSGSDLGRYAKASVVGSNIQVDGNWSNNTVIIGYLYEMKVQLPTIYLKTGTEQNRSDTRGSLIIQRVKLNFGKSGVYKTKLERLGKPDYEEERELTQLGATTSETIPFVDSTQQTIPIYERNKNVTLTISSTHPSPATLHSLVWEGDYTNKYYRSV